MSPINLTCLRIIIFRVQTDMIIILFFYFIFFFKKNLSPPIMTSKSQINPSWFHKSSCRGWGCDTWSCQHFLLDPATSLYNEYDLKDHKLHIGKKLINEQKIIIIIISGCLIRCRSLAIQVNFLVGVWVGRVGSSLLS